MSEVWYLDGNSATDSSCTPGYVNKPADETLEDEDGFVGTQVVGAASDVLLVSWTTEAGVPGAIDWIAGRYAVQIKVRVAAVDNYYFELARVDSTCSTREVIFTSGNFTGTGVKLYSDNTSTDSSGLASDRLQVRVYVNNTTGTKRWLGQAVASITDGSYVTGPFDKSSDVSRIMMPKRLGRLQRM